MTGKRSLSPDVRTVPGTSSLPAAIGRDVLALWHNSRFFILALAVVLFTLFWHFRSSLNAFLGSKVSSKGQSPDPTKKQTKVPNLEHGTSPVTPQRSIKARVQTARLARIARIASQGHGTSIKIRPKVFFSTLTGDTESHAKRVVRELRTTFRDSADILEPELLDLSYIDYDDHFVAVAESKTVGVKAFYMILVPTYNIDTILNNFLEHLQETHNDFRIDTAPLSGIAGYTVFGFGDRTEWPSEREGFCFQAREIDKWMAKLSARKRAFPLGMGDVRSDAVERLREWREGTEQAIRTIVAEGGLGEGVFGSGDPVESADEVSSDEDEHPKQKRSIPKKKASTLTDLEDLGKEMTSSSNRKPEPAGTTSPLPIDFTITGTSAAQPEAREMVPKNSPTYAALSKQGYTIIGSHSGVKICRWTKSALRGRGSCYKHSFYGIASHLCMETTPSLSQVRLLLATRHESCRNDVAVASRPAGPDLQRRR